MRTKMFYDVQTKSLRVLLECKTPILAILVLFEKEDIHFKENRHNSNR